jgi:hypothetical protein
MGWFSSRQAKTSINHYSRKDTNHHIKGSDTAANRRTLVVVPFAAVIDDRLGAGRLDTFTTIVDTELDLNTAANWDTVTPTDYTVAATRAGKDFYIYACIQTGTVPKILLSATATAPSGYTTTNSRKIGGFHCLAYVTAPTWLPDTATVGNYVVQPVTPGATKLLYMCTARAGDYKTDATTEPTWPTTPGETVVDDQITWTCLANAPTNLPAGHTFELFSMGDIVPRSVWDPLFRPICSPEGMVWTGISDLDDYGGAPIWQDIYLGGTNAGNTSVHAAALNGGITWPNTVMYGHRFGKRLLKVREFLAGAYGCNIGTNVAGGASPGYAYATVDSAGRAMLSYCGCWGNTGIVSQWLDDVHPLILGIPDTGQLSDVFYDTSFGKIQGQGTNGSTVARATGGGWYAGLAANSGPLCSSMQHVSYTGAIIGVRFGCDPYFH